MVDGLICMGCVLWVTPKTLQMNTQKQRTIPNYVFVHEFYHYPIMTKTCESLSLPLLSLSHSFSLSVCVCVFNLVYLFCLEAMAYFVAQVDPKLLDLSDLKLLAMLLPQSSKSRGHRHELSCLLYDVWLWNIWKITSWRHYSNSHFLWLFLNPRCPLKYILVFQVYFWKEMALGLV